MRSQRNGMPQPPQGFVKNRAAAETGLRFLQMIGNRKTHVFECTAGRNAAARCSGEQAILDQVGLVDIFQSTYVLSERSA